MSMRLPGKIQDLAFLRYPGYMTLLFVNTNIESRTTKNAKMISLSQYPVYPLNNQDTKILCFPLRKKILSNPYNRKGKQHLPHSFTLFSSARVQTFRLFARCLWTRTIRQWTFILATSRLSVTLRHGWRCSRNSSRRAIRACERNERVLILFFCARLLSNLLCARCMRWHKSRNQSH